MDGSFRGGEIMLPSQLRFAHDQQEGQRREDGPAGQNHTEYTYTYARCKIEAGFDKLKVGNGKILIGAGRGCCFWRFDRAFFVGGSFVGSTGSGAAEMIGTSSADITVVVTAISSPFAKLYCAVVA